MLVSAASLQTAVAGRMVVEAVEEAVEAAALLPVRP
jgi:hypothetical protein